MLKLFFSSPYNVRHENINENNALTLLKDDIRSKIIGDVNKFVYSNEGTIIKGNKNIKYIGGFYYEGNISGNPCEDTVENELSQIDNADIVCVSLLKYSAIASITELIYASFKNKRIIVFCDENITQFKTEYEYWFPILTAMRNNNDIEIVYVKNEEEIIKHINCLEEKK